MCFLLGACSDSYCEAGTEGWYRQREQPLLGLPQEDREDADKKGMCPTPKVLEHEVLILKLTGCVYFVAETELWLGGGGGGGGRF